LVIEDEREDEREVERTEGEEDDIKAKRKLREF